MGHCLVCDNELPALISWKYVLGVEKEPLLCKRCLSKLDPIQGPCCEKCDRPLLDAAYQKEGICFDCQRWEMRPEWLGILEKNRSCFSYNPFLKEAVARWKYRGDAVLASMFHEPMKAIYKSNFRGSLLVPIPLSHKRALSRGFNQAALLCEGIAEPIEALIRIEDESKQSKKSRRERLQKIQTFKFDQNYKTIVQDADITLVDDIYTTGTTIRLAAKVLLENGAKSVSSLTAIRG